MKIIRIKSPSILSYVLIISIFALLCSLCCRLAVNKEIENDINLTKSIAITIESQERSMQNNLKCVTTAVKLYLDNEDGNLVKNSHDNGKGRFGNDASGKGGLSKNISTKSKKGLHSLKDELGAGSLEIQDGDGKTIYTTADLMETNPEFVANYSAFTACPQKRTMKKDNTEIKYYPLDTSAKTRKDIFATKWLSSKKVFVDALMYADFVIDSLKNVHNTFENIDSIHLSSPSGIIIAESVKNEKDSKNRKNIVVNKYTEKPILKCTANSLTVSMPFGGLRDSCKMNKSGLGSHHKPTNDLGEYFYVISIKFSKTNLNIQLAMIIATFTILTLFTLFLIHYVNKSASQATKLAKTQEDKN